MKYEFGYCHTFCLVYALVGLSAVSGAGIIPKFVCPGDSVQVFGNIAFINCSSVVSLNINGKRNTLIARWSFENCSRNEPLLSDYNDRVFLYGNGTISIHNVHPWDQAKYIVNWQMGDKPMKDEIEIKVMAAPANDCKPVILNLGNSLFASLKSNYCGKPVATLYWKGYGDVPNTTGPVLKLNPGNQDGTYHACIEGPALTCVRNALDYCSNITIERYKSPPVLTDTFDVKIVICVVVVGIVLIIILATVVILIRKHCIKTTSRTFKGAVKYRRANGNAGVMFGENEGRTEVREVKDGNSEPGSSRAIIGPEDKSDDFHDGHVMPLLQMDQHGPTDYDTFSGQHIVPLEKHHELWTKHFDSLKWEYIKQLFNDEQKQGLKNDCGNLYTEDKIGIDDKHQVVKPHSDNVSGEQTVPLEKLKELWIKYFADNLSRQQTVPSQKHHELRKEHFNNLSGEQTVPLEKLKELWIKYFDSLSWEDIKQLLNDKQQQGLNNGCDNLSGEQTVPLEKLKELWIKYFDNLSGQRTVPLEKHHKLWNEHFDSLSWEDIKQLLNDKQQQGLNNGCDSEDKSKEATIEPSTHYQCRNNERVQTKSDVALVQPGLPYKSAQCVEK